MKISFSKRMLSVFLSALMIVSSFTAIPFVAKADDTGTLSYSKIGYYNGNTNVQRAAYYNNKAVLNIVNDGSNALPTAGVWYYDISSLPENLTSVSLTAGLTPANSSGERYNGYHTANIGTDFGINYYFVDPSKVNSCLSTSESSVGSSTGTAFSNASVANYQSTLGLSDSNLLGTMLHQYNTESNKSITFTDKLFSAISTAQSNGWSGIAIVAICNKVNPSASANGPWSDSWIGLGSMTYTAATETDPNVIAIDKVIAQYKTKMASMSGYVYTNMTDAYNTYVKALKLRKAVKFGGVVPQSANLTSLQNEMTTNLNKMVQYSKPTISTAFSVGSYSIADAYKTNLLSMPNIYNFSSNTTNVGSHSYMAAPTMAGITWLYDGETTMTAPINVFFKNGTSDNNRYVYGAYLSNSNGVTLGNSNWVAINNNTSGLSVTSDTQLQIYLLGSTLSTQSFPASQMSSSTFSSTTFANLSKVGMEGNDWHPASNYLSLVPSSVPSSALTGFTGTMTFSPQFNMQWTDKSKNGPWTCAKTISNAPITIVNYAKVRDEYLLNYLSKLNAITTYDTDQALALVKAYDALTSLNYVSNYSSASSLCTTLKTAADAMSTTVLSNYSTLESAYTSASSLLADTSNYTSTSVSDLTKLVNAVKSHFASLNPYGTDNALNTTSQVTDAATVLNTYASKILNEKIDTTALTTKYLSNNLDLTTNLPFNSDGSQRYTLSSWLEAHNKNETAKSLVQEASTKGKYETQSASASIFGTSYSFNTVTSTETGYQDKVDAKLAELNAVDLINELKATDASALANYNSAKYVFDAVDTNKFNTDGLEHYKDIKTKDYDINVMATADVISAYLTAINSTDSISSAIDTSTVDLDAHTAAMLEVAATNDSSYINQYNAYLTKVTDNVADKQYSQIADNVAYGEQISFNTNAADDSTVTYYVALYNKGDAAKVVANDDSIEPISVSRVSNFTGASLTKIANSDMIVTAYINTKQAAGDSYTVKIYNGFGNVQQVEYVKDASTVTSNGSALTVDGKTVTINSYPFYTLTGWTITKNDTTKTVVARPQYSASKTDVKFVVNGGTADGTGYNAETNTAAVNKTVTLTSTTDDFYAWVRVNNGKYEVVSYNSEAKVIPVADSEYHVMVKSGDNYTVDGTAVTATNLAGFDSIGGNVTVNQLLGAKVPFTYIDTTSNVTNSKGESGYKYYVTVTTGASVAYKSFGIAAINDNGNTYYAASNIGATNQYSYAIKATTIGSAKVGAYLTYTVDINGKSVDIRIISTNA